MTDFLPVAKQLTILFEVVQHPAGRAYTLQEVSDEIDVSLPALSQLRAGKIKNPQLNTLREICRFFDVPLRYFETRSPEECYALLAEKREEPVVPIHEISLRMTNLSRKGQRDLLLIMEWVELAEAAMKQNSELPPLPGLKSYDEE